ncbi:MAG: septum site-determining protein MinC [Eubacteriales bacterium]|nr:septum site-determining protein MinC [Eubacteriales bacterium]
MSEKTVGIRNTKEGLVLALNDNQDIGSICVQMEQKLLAAGDFFKGALLNIKYRGRDLTENEEKQLLEVLTKASGAKAINLTRAPERKQEASAVEKSKSTRMRIKRQAFFTGINEGPTKFCRGTVRSGSLLQYNGNVVVIGDVNPGGEVRAAGNVIVMGTLRGVVHAGCDGNKASVIAALCLQPTQLRIADVISRAPDTRRKSSESAPEISYVQDGLIIIEKFLQQHKG